MVFVSGDKINSFIEEKTILNCPNCSSNSLYIQAWLETPHLFFAPIFPGPLRCFGACQKCNFEIPYFKMQGLLKLEADAIKEKVRKPIWLYSGVSIGVLIILFVWYLMIMEKLNTEKYVESPQINDVFDIKLKPGEYTLYKVVSIDKDSVFVSPNKWITDGEKGIVDLRRKEYHDYTFGFSRNEWRELYNEKTILKGSRE